MPPTITVADLGDVRTEDGELASILTTGCINGWMATSISTSESTITLPLVSSESELGDQTDEKEYEDRDRMAMDEHLGSISERNRCYTRAPHQEQK